MYKRFLTQHNLLIYLFAISMLIVWADIALSEIIRVPDDYPTIQEGIDAAKDGDTVLVAEGTYYENLTIDSTSDGITLKSSGGPDATIIDGNDAGRCIEISDVGRNTIIEGFTIKNGRPIGNASVGGILLSNAGPTIKNCIITENSCTQGGGGIGGSYAFPYIYGCTISNNSVGNDGGGIGLDGKTGEWIIIENCIISGNYSGSQDGGGGGGLILNNSFKIINSLIYNNHANDMGGGIFVHSDSEAQIINTTIHNNHADDGGDGIYSEEENDNLVIFNCILWGNGDELVNCSATYSDIQGGWPGEGNIDADPLFVDLDNGDYHLQVDSPCIDAGTSDGAPPTDKDGKPRDEFPDMGAYEYQENATIVCKTDKLIYNPWERVQVLADVDNPGSSFSANLLGGIIVVRTPPKKPFILTGEVVTETIGPGLNPDIPLYNSPPIITVIAPKVTHGAFCVLYTEEYGILAIDTSTWGLESPPVAQEQFFSNFIRSYIDRYGLENLMNANSEHLLAVPSPDVPFQSTLGSAFPNTANPETWFPFQLSEPGEVTITIYNASGQLVKTLDLGYKDAGYYLHKGKAAFWDGRNDRGEKVASGIYFYNMQTRNFTATGKVVILK